MRRMRNNAQMFDNTMVIVVAVAVMTVVNGCGMNRSIGAKDFDENMVAVSCSTNARKFCHVVAGNRFSGDKHYSSCWCQ